MKERFQQTDQPRRFGAVGVCVFVLAFSIPVFVQADEVTLNLKVEQKPVILLKGEVRPAHELVKAMAKRQAGLTAFSLRVQPRPLYAVEAVRDASGRYRIDPDSLQLSNNATIHARLLIRTPRLSNAQFNALRNAQDYRLVYGLIRGIVEHEELHAKEFAAYTRKVRAVYAAPPVGRNPDPIVDPNGNVDALLAQYLQDRIREALQTLEDASAAVQYRIDQTGKETEVLFRFTDALNGEVPDPILYATNGKLRVKFEVPKGNPRPPDPKTKY